MSAMSLTWNNAGMPRPKTGVTPKRNFRMSDDLWVPAAEKAERENRTMTSVFADALTRYIKEPGAKAQELDPWDLIRLVTREMGIEANPDTDLPAAVEAAGDLLRMLGVRPVSKG